MANSGNDSDRVDLTELDVITRYSLAVRQGTANRDELIAALRADLAWLENGRRTSARVARPATATGRKGVAKSASPRKRAASAPAPSKRASRGR